MDSRSRALGLVLALGGLLVVIDTVVTVIALPAIVMDLGTTLPRGTWVTTGYIIGLIAVTPVAAWLAGRFGDARVYIAGLALFTVASLVAGFSPSVEALVATRVAQGLGGGVLQPLAAAIALRAVSKARRGRVMSLVGLPVLIGPALGAPLTALLVDAVSWRWLFWVNVPLGILAIALCVRLLPRPRTSDAPRRVDGFGLILVVGGALSLILSATVIGETGHFGPGAVVGGIIGAALLAWFTWRALGMNHPLLKVRLLGRAPLGPGAAIMALFAGGYFGSSAIAPAFVQAVRGDPVAVAGVLAVPMGLAVGLTMQVATRLVDRIAPRHIIVTGTLTAFVGAVAVGVAIGVNAPYVVVGAVSVLIGVGSGATLMPTTVAATRDLVGPDLPQGTTLLGLCSQFGNALGTAATATVLALSLGAVPGLGEGDGLAAALTLEPAARAAMEEGLARAVGLTYAVPAILILGSCLVAVLGLKKSGR